MNLTGEFPGSARSTYLNSSAHGLLPERARRRFVEHLTAWQEEPSWDAWGEVVEEARLRFARLINAHPDEVAVQANASTGLNAILGALPGGRVVTTDLDFPTAPFVAERQRGRGLTHEHVRTDGAPLRVDAWRRHLTADTTLACIPAVASFTGYRFDVSTFVEEAHGLGVPVAVDAFQAAGTYPIDVKAWDVDFLVTGVYKWLLGAAGLAFLYVKRDHHDMMPTTGGWYAQAEPGAFDPFGDLAPDARRFQFGGPAVAAAAGLTGSLDLLHEVGIDQVEAHNGRLVERVLDGAHERGFEVLTPEDPADRASIVTFRGFDAEAAMKACAAADVVVNPRLGGLRVSPHLYNTTEDVDTLFRVLDKVV